MRSAQQQPTQAATYDRRADRLNGPIASSFDRQPPNMAPNPTTNASISCLDAGTPLLIGEPNRADKTVIRPSTASVIHCAPATSAEEPPKIEIVPQIGHANPVTAVAVRMTVLCWQTDSTIQLWDVASETLLRNFEGLLTLVNAAALSSRYARHRIRPRG
jgi:hypothetical protein